MLRHELLALDVRDAVIHGDLTAARANAFRFAGLRISRGRTIEYEEGAIEARQVAASVAAAPDLERTAAAVGQLAKTCADCHARMSGPTRLVPEPVPHRAGRMTGHAWAMNELWSGIVGNSEEPWHAGAAALASEAPTTEVRAIAERAARASDPNARAAVYGELLATCARCHATTRR